jgi:hypothetical protein
VLGGIDRHVGRAAGSGGGVLERSLVAGLRASSFWAMAKMNEACVWASSLCGLCAVSLTRLAPWHDTAAPTRAGRAWAANTV